MPPHPHVPRMKDLSMRVQVQFFKLLSFYIKIGSINWKERCLWKKRKWMFKLKTFLLTQDLLLIPDGKEGRKQNSVWEKWERDIFEIGNFLLKYFFERKEEGN